MLGSIDSNTGSPDLGWDTDQFPMDIKNTTLIMKVKNSRVSLCLAGRYSKNNEKIIECIIWKAENSVHPEKPVQYTL